MRRALLALVAALALAVPAAAAPIRPAVAFEQLLAAAKAGNAAAVWSGLSAATRARYLSPSGFAKSQAGVALTAVARAPHISLVDQRYPGGGALEAVKTSAGVYGAALRVGGRWKLQLEPDVLVQPLSPAPGAVNGQVFQVAAQAMLPDPVDTGALYLDGKPLATRGGAMNGGRTVTLYANLPKGVAKGLTRWSPMPGPAPTRERSPGRSPSVRDGQARRGRAARGVRRQVRGFSCLQRRRGVWGCRYAYVKSA
jgi:hypothetical protein